MADIKKPRSILDRGVLRFTWEFSFSSLLNLGESKQSYRALIQTGFNQIVQKKW
jgi:hypothetical protein